MQSPKAFIAQQLQRSVRQCQLRGLYVAATWASEQLMGLEDDISGSGSEPSEDPPVDLNDCEQPVGARELAAILLGSSLMASGQYQRVTYNLRSDGNRKIRSPAGIFLYAYSQYLAGEKIRLQLKGEKEKREQSKTQTKEQLHRERQGQQQDKSAINPFLTQIFAHLEEVYKAGAMDSYLLYIFAVVSRDLNQFVVARKDEDGNLSTNPLLLFKKSLAMNPWNWSCWLELANYCLQHKLKVPNWDDILAQGKKPFSALEKQCGRTMFAFFMAHLYLERQRGDLALQAMEKLHKIFPTSVHLYTHVGVAYYSQRLYDQAEDCFERARGQDPYRLQHVDTYSNILYVKEKSAELSYLAHSIVETEKYSPEVCCVIGNYYSLKGQHERALTYFQRALRLDLSYLSAWTLMGHEYMELRNTAAAVQCYRSALRVSELDYRAWYGLGQTYEMLHLYQYAHYYFKKAAFLRPSDARMWSAVGNCLLKLNLRTEAIATYERAVSSGDREGIATRDLARLYRDDIQHNRAAELYFKYLQCNLFEQLMQANNSDAVECMPPSLELLVKELNEHDTGDLAYWREPKFSVVDSVIDSEQAEAVLFLAHYFREQQEHKASDFFASRLLSFHGPEGDEARMLLKELRAKHLEPAALVSLSTNNSVLTGNVSMISQRQDAHAADLSLFSPMSQSSRMGHSELLGEDTALHSLLSADEDQLNPSFSAPSSANPRRQSTFILHTNTATLNDSDSFDRHIHGRDEHEGILSDDADSSGFQFSRDDSHMSLESPYHRPMR